MNPLLKVLKSIGTFPGTLFDFLQQMEDRQTANEAALVEFRKSVADMKTEFDAQRATVVKK